MIDLDHIDRRLLAILQEDATVPIAELAERVGLTQTPCWKRVKRLQESGVITARVALLDREALDLPITAAEFLEIREPLMSERFPRALGMPGAEALVRHLNAHNIPIAVGTSSSRNSFGHKTTLHREWFGLFGTIVTADDPEVGAAKPAPDIFLTAARRLGIAPQDCLVFEDSPFGVTAAKAARMTAIAVPDEAMADSKYHHADQIIRKLADFDLAAYGLPPMS